MSRENKKVAEPSSALHSMSFVTADGSRGRNQSVDDFNTTPLVKTASYELTWSIKVKQLPLKVCSLLMVSAGRAPASLKARYCRQVDGDA